ncbi:MAG TPA: hypothetical protein PLH56_04440 [Candidatus Omnitrophota bacterium]|nr:hypothetical protein [Candidatus Omnitrophota bacterium]
MMYILAVAGICVLIGIIIIIKELRVPKEEAEAVAVTKPEELKAFKIEPANKKDKKNRKDQVVSLAQDILDKKESAPEIKEGNLKAQETLPEEDSAQVEKVEIVKRVEDSAEKNKEDQREAFVQELQAIHRHEPNFLDEEKESLKKQIEGQQQRISQLESEVVALQSQCRVAEQSVETQISEKTQIFVDKIVVLQKENSELAQELKNVRSLNAQMAEKENTLNFELAKYRAQALALEHICEDLKKQNEELSKINKE